MARTARATAAEPESVTIEFDLLDLPTAQHKAGLAGLLLQIRHMEGKTPKPDAIPKVVELSRTTAKIEFTKGSVQCLFDDVYAAEVREEWFSSKKEKEQLKGERTRETRGGKVREYLYDATRPTFPALCQYLGVGESGPAWLKLWQDMAWGVPRGVNTTRIPFEVVAGWDRKQSKANRRVSRRPCPEGNAAWASLVTYSRSQPGSPKPTGEVDGKLWLGAQKESAEQIKFQGQLDHNLLLHFWPNAVFISVPQSLKAERKEGHILAKRRFDGFAIAVPDIIDLKRFLARYREVLHSLGQEKLGERVRPPSAVVELAGQGALSLADRDLAAGVIIEQTTGKETEYSISGIDYLHFRPSKNGPRMLSAGRLTLRAGLSAKYRAVVGPPGGVPPYSNPLFRRGLMLALLDERLWFQPFGELFAEWDRAFFVPTDAPPELPRFWTDARKYLRFVEDRVKVAAPDGQIDEDDVLASTMNRFIQRYLDERIKKDKPEWDFAKFRKKKQTPPDAAEARRKLAERLFLELRSRRDQAFVDHFTNTFFAVPQYFGQRPAPKMFERMAKALFDRTDDVKTLTLMALSANGWVPTPKKETAQ